VFKTDLCIRLLVQIFLGEIHILKVISLVFNVSFVNIHTASFGAQNYAAQDDLNQRFSNCGLLTTSGPRILPLWPS
jgi:hypothetical protein